MLFYVKKERVTANIIDNPLKHQVKEISGHCSYYQDSYHKRNNQLAAKDRGQNDYFWNTGPGAADDQCHHRANTHAFVY